MRRSISVLVLMLMASTSIYAQEKKKADQNAGQQFITFYIDRSTVSPLHFKDFPLQQLAGTELHWDYINGGYHSGDGSVSATGTKFRRPNNGFGITVYPFGLRSGTTLAVRGSYSTLPLIKFALTDPAGQEQYIFNNGRAYDLGIGVVSGELSPGWGLGARSFILIGKGIIKEDRGRGERYFVEAGSGLNSGPLGMEIYFGISQNRLSVSRPHHFYTVPIGLRATVSF